MFLYGGFFYGWAQEQKIASPKLALLVGNADYHDSNLRLSNPCNDIELIEARLVQLGWNENHIISECNVEFSTLFDLIEDFGSKFRSFKSPLGFIYIAGHGVQIDSDTYYFPINARFDAEEAISRIENKQRGRFFDRTIVVDSDILGRIGVPVDATILLVVDACRDNPLIPLMYERDIKVVGYPTYEGSFPDDVKIVFSTAGTKASDGPPDANSPFAEIFADIMFTRQNQPIDRVLNAMRPRLRAKTQYSSTPQEMVLLGNMKADPPPEMCFGSCE